MENIIKKKYEFDEVFDGQSIYRKILKVMSNPGTKCDITKEASKIGGEFSGELAVAMTLLDNEVSFYSENEKLNREVEMLTHSKVDQLEEADFAFVSNIDDCRRIMNEVKVGTLPDPQDSCTIIYKIENNIEKKIEICGPGVDGDREFELPEEIGQLLEVRKQMNLDFPLGIDLICIRENGELMAFPRLIKEVCR